MNSLKVQRLHPSLYPYKQNAVVDPQKMFGKLICKWIDEQMVAFSILVL